MGVSSVAFAANYCLPTGSKMCAPSAPCGPRTSRALCSLRPYNSISRTIWSHTMSSDVLFSSSPVTIRGSVMMPELDRFRTLGRFLEDMILQDNPNCNSDDLNVRVYQYYLPIYLWARNLLDEHNAKEKRPMMLGFSCPQGGGKTTMVKFLRKLFALDGKLCSGASIDDFYLTYDEQCRLAALNPDNGLLRYRGNPGTHDISALCKTLDRIRLLNQPGAPDVVEVWQYDKTRHGGRGDRAPPEASEKIFNGLDVFLLEGWCLGFTPEGPNASFMDRNLEDVDRHLLEFSKVYSRLDAMLVIEVDDLTCVYEWRAQPEREAINAGKPGLSPEQVRDFVSRFMPSYAQYTPRLYSRDQEVIPGRELHIKINEKRQPVS